MMFLVLFGSLAVAMAVASQGNLRTAETHIHMVRAMGAAETGMGFAQQRIADASARFVVAKGVIDDDYARRLWNGSFSAADGRVDVYPSAFGIPDVIPVNGLADALLNAHLLDQNTIPNPAFTVVAERISPSSSAPAGLYSGDDWIRTALVAVDGDGQSERPAAFQITYAPLANGTDIRVTVTGYSSIGTSGSNYAYARSSVDQPARPVTRVISQDFRLTKRSEHAILAPSRIMIGKNVLVSGPLGAGFTSVDFNHGDPVIMRSDFKGLDPALDAKLERFYQALAVGDVDGDNRLRVNHPVEGAAIPANDTDYNGDGTPDAAFRDVTGDGYVSEFDIFIAHYDRDGDGRLVLSPALTAGTPAQGLTPEFTADDDLALLIDSSNPDRNRNGIYGFQDLNGNGRWDPGEPFNDIDPRTGAARDQVLGYRDGFICRLDNYAKLRGSITFRVSESQWSSAQGDYRERLRGPIIAGPGEQPLRFNASDRDLPDYGPDAFVPTQSPLQAAADGAPFEQQVALQLGIPVGQIPTYVETKPPNQPRYWHADLDPAYVYAQTGRQIWERMPFNSPSFVDWYFRPRYENMTFRNVVIPMGNNGLFINCTFIGVTFVRSYTANTHPNWSMYGRQAWSNANNRPEPITDPLDKSDFLRYTTGNVTDGPVNYDQFPDPPVIGGIVRTGDERDTKRYSNNIRFHNCLFVGSIVSDTPTEYTHTRNKLQFTGSTRFTTVHPEEPNNVNLNPSPAAMEEIAKTSMMLPNYSVDIGAFNSPTDTFPGGPPAQNVQLQGTIVAGVFDARGNTSIDGSLILTFEPIHGQGPLQQLGSPAGNPAGFNATLGYFGPEDGDGESLDPETLPIVNGQRIVGWDLDGDGLPDRGPSDPPSQAELDAGAIPVPFYGYGRIQLNWNPSLPMPDGILMPVRAIPIPYTYREGGL